MSLLVSHTLAACGGESRDNVRDDVLTSSDTIATLREVEPMYTGDKRPDFSVPYQM